MCEKKSWTGGGSVGDLMRNEVSGLLPQLPRGGVHGLNHLKPLERRRHPASRVIVIRYLSMELPHPTLNLVFQIP